jgi:hypothetical protein
MTPSEYIQTHPAELEQLERCVQGHGMKVITIVYQEDHYGIECSMATIDSDREKLALVLAELAAKALKGPADRRIEIKAS